MIANITYECPHCHAETKTGFDVGEHFTDLDKCPECSKPVSLEDFAKMEIDAIGKLMERACHE